MALSAESHLLLVQFLEAQPSSEVERKQEVLGGGGAGERRGNLRCRLPTLLLYVLMGTVQYLRNRIYKQPFPLRDGRATPDPGSDLLVAMRP